MPRLINEDEAKEILTDYYHIHTTIQQIALEEAFSRVPTVEAIPVDYIWDRAEFYEKQWLEDDNHWAKNVAEALRALLEDWDGEVGGILDKYE